MGECFNLCLLKTKSRILEVLHKLAFLGDRNDSCNYRVGNNFLYRTNSR